MERTSRCRWRTWSARRCRDGRGGRRHQPWRWLPDKGRPGPKREPLAIDPMRSRGGRRTIDLARERDGLVLWVERHGIGAGLKHPGNNKAIFLAGAVGGAADA